jgi:class 3 adenylate cyclase
MTAAKDQLKTVQKMVLVCDICSSTSILEDLLRSENQAKWRSVLISLKKFLRREMGSHHFDIYKFVGDGWILLFDPAFDARRLFGLLKRLCEEFENLFRRRIEPVLSIDLKDIGITFGLDKGTLVPIVMNQTTEYIGRPLNVAARLQSAIKDNDPKPGGKVLMSKNVFAGMRQALKPIYKVKTAKRKLRNIAGADEYICKKLWLFQKPVV